MAEDDSAKRKGFVRLLATIAVAAAYISLSRFIPEARYSFEVSSINRSWLEEFDWLVSIVRSVGGGWYLLGFLLFPLILMQRERILRIVAVVLFFATAVMAGTSKWMDSWRVNSLERVAANAVPLIRAIDAYYSNEGEYPKELKTLVPEYLDYIPDTGALGYPEYKYEVAAFHNDLMHYELSLFKRTWTTQWDSFIYWPHRPYPEYLYQGYVHPIGDWAYIYQDGRKPPDVFAEEIKRLQK